MEIYNAPKKYSALETFRAIMTRVWVLWTNVASIHISDPENNLDTYGIA